jgi:hypothetical protein
MTWITNFENDFWKIENTGIDSENYVFFKWEKAFLRITCKDVVNQSVLTVGGEDYEFFVDNEQSVIEITDLVRAFDGGEIDFVNQLLVTIDTFEWSSLLNGERMTDGNRDALPEEIPYKSDSSIDFYFQITEAMQVLVSETWTDYSATVPVSLEVADLETLEVRTKADEIYTNFIDLPCWDDMVLVEWIGHFGVLKSWWFEVVSQVNQSTKQVNIQTMDNGYNTLKNKTKSIVLQHKKANQKTQAYLSDLVLSDDVFVYWSDSATDKHEVRVETTSFEVTQRKRDVQLTLNTFAYDTI